MNRVTPPHERVLYGQSGTSDAFLSAAARDDWQFLERVRSVMLIGPPAVTSKVVASLSRDSHGPVVWVTAGERLSLPAADDVGTLIVQAIEQLSESEQQRLCEWLDQTSEVRVIATSPNPLLGGLARGEFLATLYYRLNTVYIDFSTTS